jgi:hypothetical protein
MIEYDEGQYWVRLSRTSAPQVARHAERLWYLEGHPEGVETEDLYEVGPRAEVDA